MFIHDIGALLDRAFHQRIHCLRCRLIHRRKYRQYFVPILFIPLLQRQLSLFHRFHRIEVSIKACVGVVVHTVHHTIARIGATRKGQRNERYDKRKKEKLF